VRERGDDEVFGLLLAVVAGLADRLRLPTEALRERDEVALALGPSGAYSTTGTRRLPTKAVGLRSRRSSALSPKGARSASEA
jgi:hypothetical protein